MEPVELRAVLIGKTTLTEGFYDVFDDTEMIDRETSARHFEQAEDADLLAEAAGRLCYDSFHLPNPATSTNQGYLANIHVQRHFSVMEHGQFNFYLEGVSRALLGELTRHRHQSFSVRSQRYVDESDSNYVIPPVFYEYLEGDDLADAIAEYHAAHFYARRKYGKIQKKLVENGAKRKVANDAARYVLPEGTETKLIVSGNGRSWLELLSKRDSPQAAKEIANLAQALNSALTEASPNTFQKD